MPRATKNPVSKAVVDTKNEPSFTTARRTGGDTAPPVMYINNRPQTDVLDHGLDDYKYHHVWVDSGNPTQFYSYYVDGYRFVPYDEVKERLETDDLRKHLFKETVDNRVGFDSLRLMRIATQEFLNRQQDGYTAVGGGDVGKIARQELESYINKGREDERTGFEQAGVRISVDEQHGEKEITTIGGEE